MSNLHRFSSRRTQLAEAFLNQRLRGARFYRRIAGYFRSSIFELASEALDGIERIQIVCNSDLDLADWRVAQRAREVALLERWNEPDPAVEALLRRERYRKLDELLRSGRLEIRVVPAERLFLHGKAGVIEYPDGRKTCFIGSANESRTAFAGNYEIVWEDRSPEGVQWVEEEFAALWAEGVALPDLIVEQIRRIAEREEVVISALKPPETPAAALAEAPIYRSGEGLQPWQRAFVTTFLDHREIYGKARLLLADEVGLGKTLSLATAALVAALLDDGPVLILCPATLTLQWQTELADKLGIPSAVWSSRDKCWLDPQGHLIRTRGAEDIARCPYQIAIVSTGLIFHGSDERTHLLERKYGVVVLDEAHRARRRGGLGPQRAEPNNLLDFMRKIAPKTRHLLLGTATPIQTEVAELWDLLSILSEGAEFVLGRTLFSRWRDWEKALPVVKGERTMADEAEAWEWLRDPLPPAREGALFQILRFALELPDDSFSTAKGYSSLRFDAQQALNQALEPDFFTNHNPIVRHTVLRRRSTLEKQGLLERVGVRVHPDPNAPVGAYPGVPLQGLSLLTNHPFTLAYTAAEEFTRALAARTRAAGFMKTLLLQRICSSFAAGRSTAQKLLRRETIDDDDEAVRADLFAELSADEIRHLRAIVTELSRPEARDPKLEAIYTFLTNQRSDSLTWLEHGCIIFSQYYDTAHAVATALAERLPNEPVALYAGAGRSAVWRNGASNAVERDAIKAAVRHRDIRLVVATDAACEGLNLQTLGTLINVDLPWNPSRLAQRLGRIKRFGQRRPIVDMLNLVYQDTHDEKIYQALSRRMKDIYDLFGSLPDTIEDEWIEQLDQLEAQMDQYLHLRDQARTAFELRYEQRIDPDHERWERCARVLARRDIIDRLSRPWE
ncbi:phospholipase D-like domain-containing anti-phage protein [Chloroflexus sp.]|uniref:phospholipase D-like domain-containing anti-phage protein n=1 Tax=Chloroflexus sp. TaxID=1904827 RepID=UPI002ACED715|nr:phospholipase D-like domain-containing anti-phage protein [Chloroflexus sp.]